MYRLIFAVLIMGAAMPAVAAGTWVTPAEAADFRTTPDYAATLNYLERLEQAAPDKIRLVTFGTTAQGRPMTVVIASGNGTFTPAAARRAHKPVILVQAGIHSGEIEGKDAGLMLLRDFAVTGKMPHWLDHAVLLYIPVFNVDGHENASQWHRFGQNGPRRTGTRTTAQRLNLNRDYMKADTPEMRAWLALWQKWLPDFLIDVHTTDGANYQYDLTYYLEDADKLPPAVSEWQQTVVVDQTMPALRERGHLPSIYLAFKDNTDPLAGITNFGSGPRYSTGYAALQNRPALLIETHMLKPYAVRVDVVYDLVQLLVARIDAHPKTLLAVTHKADAATIARADDLDARVALAFRHSDKTTPYRLKGYAFTVTHSEVSGSDWIQYDASQPKTYTIPNHTDLVPDLWISPPAAYAIPPQWTTVIARLDTHGIDYWRIKKPTRINAEIYLLSHPVWADRSYQGHVMVKSFDLNAIHRDIKLPAGTVIVPMAQRTADVAIELLEPQAPDSLLHWGFLDLIFERRGYGEPRKIEKIARDMLANNPKLRERFRHKVKTDPQFANNPYARLDFFFKRTQWYAVQHNGMYPVLRLNQAPLDQLR